MLNAYPTQPRLRSQLACPCSNNQSQADVKSCSNNQSQADEESQHHLNPPTCSRSPPHAHHPPRHPPFAQGGIWANIFGGGRAAEKAKQSPVQTSEAPQMPEFSFK